MITQFELEPINQKSFYGKAIVKKAGGMNVLTSYESQVAVYHEDTRKFEITVRAGLLSATTLKHIAAFRHHFSLKPMSKKELMKL